MYAFTTHANDVCEKWRSLRIEGRAPFGEAAAVHTGLDARLASDSSNDVRRPGRSLASVGEMLPFETAIGTCGVSWSDVGITGVTLPRRRDLRGGSGLGASAGVPDDVRAAIAGMVMLLEGEHCDLRFAVLDEDGLDEFRRRVYAATREIGPGATSTYGEVAREIGEPGASRAVGAALAHNPFSIIVPCHRVLAATGALHGFSAPGGIATKRRMLEIERAAGFTQEALFA